jgi:lipoate-protein ligase A
MQCILSKTNDIYFNLAAEEYLLRNKAEDYLMIWISDPAVVVGKHQNALAEMNAEFILKEKINVARRLTGGGTVYHDNGNINFTFIMNGEQNKLIDFKKFVEPVVCFIRAKGVPVEIGGRNDILIDGYKISGNAEHIFKTRVLHHGTILYNSDLNTLKKALQVKPGRFIDKAIQSNRSAVINLMEYISNKVPAVDFAGGLFVYLQNYFNNTNDYVLNDLEIADIQKLRNEKYTSWDWIFGYSPAFKLERTIHLRNSEIKIELEIFKGFVQKAIIMSTDGSEEIRMALENLQSCRFGTNEMRAALQQAGTSPEIANKLLEILL